MFKMKSYNKCNLCVGTLVLGLVLIGNMHKVSAYELKPNPQITKTNCQIEINNNKYSKFGLNKYSFSYDVKNYQLDGKIEDAHIVDYNGLKIVKPLHEEFNKQVFSYSYIEEVFNTLPQVLTRNIKEIQLLDYSSVLDEYWTKKYNIKKFKTYASSGNDNIYFFENGRYTVEPNKRILRPTLVHESAHIYDVKISSQEKRFSNSTEWLKIMYSDVNKTYGAYCSEYAQDSSSSEEDFAEAVEQYVTNKDKFTNEYPNRSSKIQDLFNK